MSLKSRVKEWMKEAVEAGDCTDSAGVISPTQLAEAACDDFDAWTEDYDVPEMFYELAAEVADEYEVQS